MDFNKSVYSRVRNQSSVSTCVYIPDKFNKLQIMWKKMLFMIPESGKVYSHSSDEVVPTHSSKLVQPQLLPLS